MKICDKCNTSYADSIAKNMKECTCGGNLIDSQRYKKMFATQSTAPRCPTCGSTKIRRISSTEKVVNTMAFGFFGNKRKKQFECLNPKCKYKW